MTCSALDKAAKDFSLVTQGFKMGGRLKRWGNAVCRAISTVLACVVYLMVSSTVTPTVFWPLGLQRSGFCYGWKVPQLCVVGVLEVDSVGFSCIFLPCCFHGVRLLQEEEAVSALDAACTVPAWRALQESCGGNPEVIGLCKFDAQSNTITIAAL